MRKAHVSPGKQAPKRPSRFEEFYETAEIGKVAPRPGNRGRCSVKLVLSEEAKPAQLSTMYSTLYTRYAK